MQVLVFKTNLSAAGHVAAIGTTLNVHPDIHKWNVDLNDCDNVLRIVTNKIAPREIETMLLNAGYYCEELQ